MLASLLMSITSGSPVAAGFASGRLASNAAIQTEPPFVLGPGDAWHLSFHLSGGFAGVDRELAIDSSGKIRAADRRRSLAASADATPAELTRLKSLVAKVSTAQAPDDGMCRDCLIYEIRLTTDTRSQTTRVNDIQLSPSGLAELVGTLTDVLTRVLAK